MWMFQGSEKPIVKICKKHIIINSILISLAISSTIAVLIINMIERQRILTQIMAALSLLILILLVLFLRSAYKNLINPINELYKQMPISTERGHKENVYLEAKEGFNKLNSLIALIEDLNKNIPFKHIIENIYNSFNEYIPYTYIGVALLDDNQSSITASYGFSDKFHKKLSEKLLGYREEISNTSLKKIIESGEERIINDLEEYLKDKPPKLYNQMLIEEDIKASITFPLKNENRVFGMIFFSSNTKNVYNSEHVKFIKTLANSITLSLEKEILINNMTIGSTLSLARLTEERDSETGEHLVRMKDYSKLIAVLLSTEEKYKNVIDMDFINNIEKFSPLHDIGKVAIRDEILLKPSSLTPEEFEIMKTHTTYGARVLELSEESVQKNGRSIFKMGIEIVESHHEKWDGTGYPYGKKGEEIPLSARIVAVADVFDALTSIRPYKRAFTIEESVKIINDGSGTHFDPEIINLFNTNIDKIKEIYYKCDSFNISTSCCS
jgi:response regulator RpfG family c-di-GMP phosphodiesterase